MSAIDDIARADSELSLDTNAGGTSFRQKVLDIWWRVCSKTGLTKLIAAFSEGILTRQFPKLGPDWRPTKVLTSTQQEIAALPQNFANSQAKLDALQKQVTALSANLPVQVNKAVTEALKNSQVTSLDPTVFGNAVVDALYTRIKSNTTTGA